MNRITELGSEVPSHISYPRRLNGTLEDWNSQQGSVFAENKQSRREALDHSLPLASRTVDSVVPRPTRATCVVDIGMYRYIGIFAVPVHGVVKTQRRKKARDQICGLSETKGVLLQIGTKL